MTNIGHFRAASEVLKQFDGAIPTTLWICPPTKMDKHQLIEEGVYSIFGASGARTEIPGCSLCMGNQARVAANSTVISTSTRNFPNRLGAGANVYLSSSELAAVSAVLGKIPNIEAYMAYMKNIDTLSESIYRYLNFNEIKSYMEAANRADIIPAVNIKVGI